MNYPLRTFPFYKKRLIRTANRLGIPIITATQMLDSMANSPSPTRAEVSDVANAILDGTDAVMLSNETAVGKYPVQAVATMAKIARRTEEERDSIAPHMLTQMDSQNIPNAISGAVGQIAKQLKASAIMTLTKNGCNGS